MNATASSPSRWTRALDALDTGPAWRLYLAMFAIALAANTLVSAWDYDDSFRTHAGQRLSVSPLAVLAISAVLSAHLAALGCVWLAKSLTPDATRSSLLQSGAILISNIAILAFIAIAKARLINALEIDGIKAPEYAHTIVEILERTSNQFNTLAFLAGIAVGGALRSNRQLGKHGGLLLIAMFVNLNLLPKIIPW